MVERKPTDWEAIEREYRAGQLSVSEIARQHGISHTAINKKAKAKGWTRNLAARVREEVSERLVSDGVSAASARETIDAAAARAVDVVRSHRADITKGRKIAQTLFDELADGSDPVNREIIEEEIEAETAGDGPSAARRRAMMLRAVSLPSRAGTLLNLSSVIKTLIGLERQAFNLDENQTDEPADGSVVGLLERIAQSGQRLVPQQDDDQEG